MEKSLKKSIFYHLNWWASPYVRVYQGKTSASQTPPPLSKGFNLRFDTQLIFTSLCFVIRDLKFNIQIE